MESPRYSVESAISQPRERSPSRRRRHADAALAHGAHPTGRSDAQAREPPPGELGDLWAPKAGGGKDPQMESPLQRGVSASKPRERSPSRGRHADAALAHGAHPTGRSDAQARERRPLASSPGGGRHSPPKAGKDPQMESRSSVVSRRYSVVSAPADPATAWCHRQRGQRGDPATAWCQRQQTPLQRGVAPLQRGVSTKKTPLQRGVTRLQRGVSAKKPRYSVVSASRNSVYGSVGVENEASVAGHFRGSPRTVRKRSIGVRK